MIRRKLLATLFLFFIFAASAAAEHKEETWVHFFDAGKGLWAKKEIHSGEVLYLHPYGAYPDQVAFLEEEQVRDLAVKARLRQFIDSEKAAHAAGFGDSLFRPSMSVGEVEELLLESGWRIVAYEMENRVYGKERTETKITLPRNRSRELKGPEALSILTSAGVTLSAKPYRPRPEAPTAKSSKPAASNNHKE